MRQFMLAVVDGIATGGTIVGLVLVIDAFKGWRRRVNARRR